MIREFGMKNFIFFLIVGLALGLNSCKHDDDIIAIDYTPIEYEVLVVNSVGDNLLEESTPGNILEKEMYIELAGERYDVNYGRPDEPEFPYPPLTRVYMPMWYGAFIAPYWYPYPELPERDNRLYVGEFPGDARSEITFILYLDGHSYEISYVNKKINGLDIDRHFYLDGKEIEGPNVTIVL